MSTEAGILLSYVFVLILAALGFMVLYLVIRNAVAAGIRRAGLGRDAATPTAHPGEKRDAGDPVERTDEIPRSPAGPDATDTRGTD
ncbi:hypothetical protein PACID_30600 [Acidipropionibacterium acidipropionici ATCC 4875]|uniref:Uncharacterized protein n=1 Tax=Acidipropionibacterium acidipropionici (strain ATCC 4875 / DSM 20272 / JCM 6432 / NBRC 12425 / NCIMB 8070 / 4) TaxID=1171373 RepID=K7RS21_ACIA4|nr:hypothetical protein [Acidipropionibacterium acidipropionici]AFV90824.1 hypothetical protein PACID_30600 [Acidipropionibacterium acidipropionici ATCC 4875]ALN15035.1 hypothetical protein ASQ49_06860 [Acidipropionibacterium acidipropionici]APZ09213.1 hypothetical protein BWX38_08065 [Acidipropionibacterium acidipropionici]